MSYISDDNPFAVAAKDKTKVLANNADSGETICNEMSLLKSASFAT